jgi:heterodisulfide reductase subunit C
MTVRVNRHKVDNPFVAKVEALSGQDLLACYQCGKCSAGCPMAKYMDILPSQVIRYSQLGLEEELLNSESIWNCVSCLTCNSRCPKGVRIAQVFEALRQIELRERHDYLEVENVPRQSLSSVPPIALIGAMRKYTS